MSTFAFLSYKTIPLAPILLGFNMEGWQKNNIKTKLFTIQNNVGECFLLNKQAIFALYIQDMTYTIDKGINNQISEILENYENLNDIIQYFKSEFQTKNNTIHKECNSFHLLLGNSNKVYYIHNYVNYLIDIKEIKHGSSLILNTSVEYKSYLRKDNIHYNLNSVNDDIYLKYVKGLLSSSYKNNKKFNYTQILSFNDNNKLDLKYCDRSKNKMTFVTNKKEIKQLIKSS